MSIGLKSRLPYLNQFHFNCFIIIKMLPESEDDKTKAKLSLLKRIKNFKMKSDESPLDPKQAKNYTLPIPSKIDMPEIGQKRSLFNGGKPQVYLYPEVHQKNNNQGAQIGQMVEQGQKQEIFLGDNPEAKDENKGRKYKQNDDEIKETEKQAKAREDVRRINRVKKPYYEHYSKQGVYQPSLPHVKQHDNPSGRPPNIPEQLLKDIQVVPKRPWVFFGPENIPPTDCQQINASNFQKIFQEAKKDKRHNSGILRKSNLRNRKLKKNQEQFSQISDDFTSNFNITDSVDLSRDSELISEFRSQSKKGIANSIKDEDDEDDDEDNEYSQFSMSGSVTQKQKYNLFDSDDEQDDNEDSEDEKPKKMKKKMSRYSENPSEKPSVFSESMSDKFEESDMQESQEQSKPRKRLKKAVQRKEDSMPKRITRRSQKSLLQSQSQLPSRKPKKASKKPIRKTRNQTKMKDQAQSNSSLSSEKEKESSPEEEMSERKRSLRKRNR